MRDSTRKGCASEMLVAARFADIGHIVCFPMIVCPYDLIVDTGNRLVKVQVKTAYLQRATVRANGYRHDRAAYIADLTGKSSKGHRRYTVGAFDYLAAVCDTDIYVVPEAVLLTDGQMRREFKVKPAETITSERKDATGAAERYLAYKNNFDLAPYEA
jgi:hypothetical protein